VLRQLYKIIWLHVTVGYVHLLLGITAAIDFLCVLDVYRFERTGRSLEPVIAAMWTRTDLWPSIPLLLFFFLVIAPSFLSIFRVLIGSREIGGTEFWVSERWVIFSQIGAGLFLGWGYALSKAMQLISGYRGLPLGTGYEFTAWLAGSMDFLLKNYLVLYSFLMQLLLAAGAQILQTRLKRPEAILAYMTKVQLNDVRGEFYPIHNRNVLNFDVENAPAIRFVRKDVRASLDRYQKAVPGTMRAADILEVAWRDSTTGLRRLLAHANFTADSSILLFNSIESAIAAVIAEIDGPKRVIVSPYEQPSESAIWPVSGETETIAIKVAPEFYGQPATQQTQQVAIAIDERLSSGRVNLVLLSEVCHATGLVTQVGAILKKVSRQCSERQIQPPGFVIVGSYAVGNLERPGLDCADGDLCRAYVAGGHHWLYAPETCGFVIKPSTDGDVARTREVWISRSQVWPGAPGIFGLRSSLRCLEAIGLEDTRARSLELRDRLVSLVRDQFEIVGEDSGLERSLMLSLAPKAGLQWLLPSACAFQRELNRESINARVISEDPACSWLRLAFPYFLEDRHVRQLSRYLHAAVKPEVRQVGQPPFSKALERPQSAGN
jgi:selenocysteine lyase/cysteine desulfurase